MDDATGLANPAGHGAPAHGAPAAVTFFWRPGCGFCTGLERRLGSLGVPMEKINIWEDPDAAATVRSIARGNETVPTVVVGNERMVNPSASRVLEAIRAEAPHLEPENAEQLDSHGPLGRLIGNRR